jgi:pimeloyl-ACP methyl ester carboxylesterase
MSRTFVLVHGAWHGGWCWRSVSDRLRASGHRVFAPTCTGLGERAHLLSRTITLDTFTRDVSGVIEAEELHDIVLVGHSFGGLPVSGVADRMPERIRSVVFLDSMLVQPGRTPADGLTAEVAAARRKAAEETSGGLSLPTPPASAFGVTGPADAAWLERRLTPHPFSTYASRLEIGNAVGNGLPCTYVACTRPAYLPLEGARTWARQQAGWRWEEIATGHDAMVTAPEELAGMLERLAAD